jgi:hypothetical protein
MENLTDINFKAIQQALNKMSVKCEEQEKRINSYIQTQQMMMTTINTLQQEVMVLKAQNMGSGPTKV